MNSTIEPGAKGTAWFAWAAWGLLALGLCANTLLKRDELMLAAGGSVEGRIVSRDTTGVTFTPRGLAVPVRYELSSIAVVCPLGYKSVTGNYRYGSERWRTSREMYSAGAHGFLYLPHAAMLFLPFELLPAWAGEVLWRWVMLAAYAGGVWSLCRKFLADRPNAFLLATLLAMPASLGSAQNGQTNLAIGGLCAFAAVCASEQRWGRTSLWLMLALACKPVMLPVIMLMGATRPRSLPALAAGLAVFLLAPFLHTSPAYVLGEYHGAIGKMLAAADPGSWFSDIRGMLRDFGLPLDEDVVVWARLVAAILTLFACVWLTLTRRDPWRSLATVALGVCYILVFSPRTEGLTYAMIGPIAGVLATSAIISRRWTVASLLISYCLILQFSKVITGEEHKYWLRPLCTLALIAWILLRAIDHPSHHSREHQ